MPINLVGIVSLGVALLNLVLGFIVFFRNPRKTNNIVYAVIVSSISVWIVFTYLYNNPSLLEPKDWLKLVYLASYGMLFSQMLFAYFFPKRIKSHFLQYAVPILLTTIPSLYVLLIQDSVIESVVNHQERFVSVAEMGSGYFLYTLPNVLGILLLAIYFLRKSKAFVGYEKAQIKFYILGALLMMVPLVIVDYGIPLLNGDTSFFVYGPLFAIPFSVALAYSILENRFITITNILKKSLYFGSNLVYAIATLLLANRFSENETFKGINSFIVSVVYISIAIALYTTIYKNLVSWIINVTFKEGKKKDEVMKNFIQVSNMELTMDRIMINIKRTIREIFKIEKVGVILFDKNTLSIRYQHYADFVDLETKDLLEIVRYWDDIASDPIIISDEIKRETILDQDTVPERVTKVIEFMDHCRISAILPFNSRTYMNGIVLLGYRSDEYPLTIEDIETLEQLIFNISVSISRAVLYQEVQEFNKTLKSKVDEQTKELQVKVEELQEARRKERDMIDIMGHELRTPATIVKLNAGLMEKYIGSNPQDFKKYLDRIKDSIENEIKLINTLLTSAKLEGNRVEISNEKVDIVAEIDMVIHGHEREAEEKSIQLVNSVKDGTPAIYGDKVRTIEVLDNLIGNAVKYTKTGSVTVQTEYDADMVKVSIIDTGDGIPAEELPKLGNKFHRVGNYIESNEHVNIVRPGGTGLGLFVVFGLVRLMKGDIWVESEVGKGSKFIFTLPIYKDQEVTQSISGSKNMFERLGLRR